MIVRLCVCVVLMTAFSTMCEEAEKPPAPPPGWLDEHSVHKDKPPVVKPQIEKLARTTTPDTPLLKLCASILDGEGMQQFPFNRQTSMKDFTANWTLGPGQDFAASTIMKDGHLTPIMKYISHRMCEVSLEYKRTATGDLTEDEVKSIKDILNSHFEGCLDEKDISTVDTVIDVCFIDMATVHKAVTQKQYGHCDWTNGKNYVVKGSLSKWGLCWIEIDWRDRKCEEAQMAHGLEKK